MGGITMWIARDKNGNLWLYVVKPEKGICEWIMPNITGDACIIDTDLDGFEDIKWEDDEPRELILK